MDGLNELLGDRIASGGARCYCRGGAGCLYCAITLVNDGFKGDITVLERGQTFESRFLSRDDWTFDPHAVLEGEGGHGFNGEVTNAPPQRGSSI